MFNSLDYFKDTSNTLKHASYAKNKFSTTMEVVVFILSYFAMLLILALTIILFTSNVAVGTDSYILLTNTCFIFSILFSLFIIIFVEKRNLRSVGFSRENVLSSLVKGLCFGFVMFVLVAVVGTVLGVYKFNSLDLSTLYLAIPYLLTFTIQSFAEEIYTRGWVIPLFSRNHSVIVALLISTFLFVLSHMGNVGFNVFAIMNIILFGLLLSFLLLKLDNIWVCGGIHTAWNFTQGYLMGFNVSGLDMSSLLSFSRVSDGIIAGGAFGPESGLITTFIILIALISVYKFDFL